MSFVSALLLVAPLLAEPQPQPSEDVRQQAKESFDQGLVAVADAKFELAVESFERAYSLRPHPVTLFNLALALEKAERLAEAWEVFEAVIDLVESDAERREVRRHMRAIGSKIALLEVHATPKRRLCLDGAAMPRDEHDDLRLALEPGTHSILLDDHEIRVELEPGDQRVLLLEQSEELIEGRRRSTLMPAMIGTAIGTGGLALGLGGAAAGVDDPDIRTGLAAGAATSAGLALVAGVVALLIEREVVREPRPRDVLAPRECPGTSVFDERIDLRLAPTIRRPAAFSQLELIPSMPIPSMPIPSKPQPTLTLTLRGIAPKRSEN